jgi:hypothetical protein
LFFAFFALFCGYSDLFPMDPRYSASPTLAFCSRFIFRRTRGNLPEQPTTNFSLRDEREAIACATKVLWFY